MAEADDGLDAVVVGAGWAGLGVSYALARRGVRHRVLERGRIGETWRTQRWDAFRMNTPNLQTVMPGERYAGPEPMGMMTRDAFVAMLEGYAARHALPVEPGIAVTELARAGEGGFRLATGLGALRARNVVVASGSVNWPHRPAWAVDLPPGMAQIDVSDYRNPAVLPEGAVLVVGNGQSGGQIAEELAFAGRRVFLATSRVGRVPRTYRGQDIMVWLVASGLFDVPRKDFVQPSGAIAGRPLLGALRTISLQSLSAQGVVLLGHLDGFEDGRFRFADDVAENVRFADEFSAASRARIDAYIAEAGIAAPAAEPDPAETVAARLPDSAIRRLHPDEAGLAAVLWCTGFRGDFGWVRVPGALDARGQPQHVDGIGAIPGLYFPGMDFASTRRSGTILAIEEEATRLAEAIVRRQ